MNGTAPELLDEDEPGQKRLGMAVDPGRVVLSFKRGWRLIPLLVGVGMVVGLAAAFLAIKPKYKSEAVLIWEPLRDVGRTYKDLYTQAGILKLPATLAEARKRLKLETPVHVLAETVDIYFSNKSTLISVEARWNTARGAADIARVLVDVFLDHQRSLARARASELVAQLEGDIKTSRAKAAQAQSAYDAFRDEHGVVDPAVEAKLALETVAELKSQSDAAQSDASALAAQAQQIDVLMRQQPKTRVQTAVRSNLAAARLAELQAELTEAQVRLSADHPTIASLRAQIASLKQKAESGSDVVSSSAVASNPAFDAMRASLSSARAEQAAASERRKSYESTLQAAEVRVAALSAIEGQARALRADVEVAQQHVTELETQLAKAREAVRDPAVEFRVLTPPVEASAPEPSTRRVVLIACIALGLLAAVATLIVKPFRDGRVYTAREAAFWSRLPVIASSAWPLREQEFYSFVEELNDHAAVAKGTTLIIGAGPREVGLAKDLAEWLGPEPTKVMMHAAQSGDGMAGAPPGGHDASRGHMVLRDRQGTAVARWQAPAAAFYAWQDRLDGPMLRRAVRMADRVVVLVGSGSETFGDMSSLTARLGRQSGVALILVGVPDDVLELPDRLGDVQAFWRGPLRSAAA